MRQTIPPPSWFMLHLREVEEPPLRHTYPPHQNPYPFVSPNWLQAFELTGGHSDSPLQHPFPSLAWFSACLSLGYTSAEAELYILLIENAVKGIWIYFFGQKWHLWFHIMHTFCLISKVSECQPKATADTSVAENIWVCQPFSPPEEPTPESQACQSLDLIGLSLLKSCKDYIAADYRLPNLINFVIAARMDEATHLFSVHCCCHFRLLGTMIFCSEYFWEWETPPSYPFHLSLEASMVRWRMHQGPRLPYGSGKRY